MAGPYDIYPAVDSAYAFPPEVRQAAANSPELKLVMDTNVAAAVAAAKISPAFTGTPTAPTAAQGNSSSILANTSFVAGAIADAKVSPAFTGSPTAPDTDTSANDGRLANTKSVQALIAANKVAPNFTGNATSQSPNRDENNTRIATMASVRAAMQLFGLGGDSQYGYYGTDWNSYRTTGFFRGDNYSNGPGSGWFWVTVQRYDDNYVGQVALGFTDNNLRQFVRTETGGSWSSWREISQSQGDFGNGSNWNDLKRNGVYRNVNASGSANGPGGYGYGYLQVLATGTGYVQIHYPDTANRSIAIRQSYDGNSWSTWQSIRTSPPDFNVTLTNNAGGSVIATREGRWVNLNFSLYCGSGFGINGIGTIAFIPDGARPQYQNAEVVFRTSDGYTVWGSIGRDNGALDWRGGGTGGGAVSAGVSIYGTVTYMGQY